MVQNLAISVSRVLQLLLCSRLRYNIRRRFTFTPHYMAHTVLTFSIHIIGQKHSLPTTATGNPIGCFQNRRRLIWICFYTNTGPAFCLSPTTATVI